MFKKSKIYASTAYILSLTGFLFSQSVTVKAEDNILKVSRATCERFAPDIMKDVEYTPGIDAHGNQVVPADLHNQAFNVDIPKTIRFNLDMNVFTSVGRTDLAELFPDASTHFGAVEYNIMSGQLKYNGKTLNSEQNEALSIACQEYFNQNIN